MADSHLRVGKSKVVVFDTNAYRLFSRGLTPDHAKMEARNLVGREGKAHIQGLANPIVLLELLANLEDPSTGPTYNECLAATCALATHCSEGKDSKTVGLVADPESNLCWLLFKRIPEAHAESTENLCRYSRYIAEDPDERTTR